MAFVAAASSLAINFILWVWEKVRGWHQRRSAQVRVVEAIAQLDQFEKTVLRDFYPRKARHRVTGGPSDRRRTLAKRDSVTLRPSRLSGFGRKYLPVRLAKSARMLLAPVYVDLPTNPTDAELEEIRADRPNFLREIQRHDQWRGGY
jgi:hypothetical protein